MRVHKKPGGTSGDTKIENIRAVKERRWPKIYRL